MGASSTISYRIRPKLTSEELNELFCVSWPDHRWRDFQPILNQSLTYICAYGQRGTGGVLIGYVNLAWDGGIHAFLLDTTVRPDWRRRGIGTELVRRAASVARACGIEWLHVDCQPCLWGFYAGCGFQRTTAGLRKLCTDD